MKINIEAVNIQPDNLGTSFFALKQAQGRLGSYQLVVLTKEEWIKESQDKNNKDHIYNLGKLTALFNANKSEVTVNAVNDAQKEEALKLITQRMQASVQKHNNSIYLKLNFLTLGLTYLLARIFNLYKFLAYDKPHFAATLEDLQNLCRLLDQQHVEGFVRIEQAELNDSAALKAKLATIDTIRVGYDAEIDWENIDLSPLVNLKELQLYGQKDVKMGLIPQPHPLGIGTLQKLESLTILNFGLNSFPQEIRSLKGLKALDLGFNPFIAFPQEIFELKELEDLCFHSCGGGRPHGRGMLIDDNTIEKFKELTHLKKLDLGYCELREDQKIKIKAKLDDLRNLGIMPNFQEFEHYS